MVMRKTSFRHCWVCFAIVVFFGFVHAPAVELVTPIFMFLLFWVEPGITISSAEVCAN